MTELYVSNNFYTTKNNMNHVDSLKEQIEKTKGILKESQDNFAKNPDSYSAQLLLMSTENYLVDLLKELDAAEVVQRGEA